MHGITCICSLAPVVRAGAYTDGGIDLTTARYHFDNMLSRQAHSYCSDNGVDVRVVALLVVRVLAQPMLCLKLPQRN